MNSKKRDFSRRSFLKTSGLVAAAATVPTFMSAPKVHAGENNMIKLAWIGCGGRGGGAIRQALHADPNTKLWAVADAFADKANNAVQSVIDTEGEDRVDVGDRVFSDLDGYKAAIDSLGDGDVAVLTTTSTFRALHFEYVVNKKEQINIFAEKPLGADIPSLKRFKIANEKALEKGIQVGVGLNNRHYFRTAETVKAVQDGLLGDIVTCWVYRLQGPHVLQNQGDLTPLQHQIRNHFCYDWTSGGFIVDALIHNIDICCWAMQDYPVEAFGTGGRTCRKSKDQLIDCGAIEYVFADGRKLMLQTRTIPNCWNFFQANIQGKTGCCQVGEGVGEPRIYEGYDMLTPARKAIWEPTSPANDSYQTEHDCLFKAIRANKPWNEVQYAIDATFTAILGRTAMETGQRITADEVWKSEKKLVPDIDNLRMDSESPAMPDADGNYWIPEQGVTQLS
ncbi:MAG: twin-arginine translocation signal domain-containing protein [Planctomycetia bacterium]|nr:twin-arginine translocation signal domain-containing protein [Planctomycetia bacterium]